MAPHLRVGGGFLAGRQKARFRGFQTPHDRTPPPANRRQSQLRPLGIGVNPEERRSIKRRFSGNRLDVSNNTRNTMSPYTLLLVILLEAKL